MSAAFPISDSLLHICLNSFSCHNVLVLLSLSGVANLSLLVGVCTVCMLAYKCLQMKWWAAVMVVAIPSQIALLMCPCVSSGKFSVLATCCSCAFLHYLQLTSDCCLILASHLAARMIPAIAIISRLLCLKGRVGRSNTSLRMLCSHFAITWSLQSTCHMQGDWYCRALP